MQVWSHANWNFHYPQTADRRRLTALARDRNAAQGRSVKPCIEKIEHFGFVLPVMQLAEGIDREGVDAHAGVAEKLIDQAYRIRFAPHVVLHELLRLVSPCLVQDRVSI